MYGLVWPKWEKQKWGRERGKRTSYQKKVLFGEGSWTPRSNLFKQIKKEKKGWITECGLLGTNGYLVLFR